MNLQRQTYFSVSIVGVPIRNTADYSPFGVQLDGRTIQGDFYRYGYQGSEKDDESKGGGNSYTTYFRQLDPRVGRWFSIDPKPEAGVSSYSSMDNNPIMYKDILGNYTKKRAEKMAKRAESNGYDATVKHNEGTGKNNYGVAYHKRNESNTGSYMASQYSGKFRGIGEEGLVMDNEIKIDKVIEANDVIGFSTLMTTESIILHVAPKFKSNSSNISFSSLSNKQQNWRVMAEMGKSGKVLFRVSKCLGTASTISAPILTGVDMYQKSNDGDPKTNIEAVDGVDLGVGAIGVAGTVGAYFGIISNPVGWGIGIATGVYFIGRTVYDLDLQVPSNIIIDSPIPNQNKQKIQG